MKPPAGWGPQPIHPPTQHAPAVAPTQIENPEYAAASGGLRTYPIGEDAQGSRYFFFSSGNEDCRLFREDPPWQPKAPGGQQQQEPDLDEQASWHTECTTLEQLQAFAGRMADSRNRREKQLGDLLLAQILPRLVATAEQRRRQEEKQALYDQAPKKRSGRIVQLQLKKEEDEKARKVREDEERRKQAERSREREVKRRDRDRDVQMAAMEQRRRVYLGTQSMEPQLSREERMQQRSERLQNGLLLLDEEEEEEPPARPGVRRAFPAGWSPLGVYVFTGCRTSKCRAQPNMQMLANAARGNTAESDRHKPRTSTLQARLAASSKLAYTSSAAGWGGGQQQRYSAQVQQQQHDGYLQVSCSCAVRRCGHNT